MEHDLTLVLVLVAALGVAAQWLAWRLKLPAIVLLLLAGALAGPATGLIDPARDLGEMFAPILKIAVAIILFEGGLTLRLHELKEAFRGVRRLVLLGVPIAFGLGTAAAILIGGLSPAVGAVFGAIIVVTGPTVILPLLRHARLARRPASYLKWEGIVNDPIGALLAVLVFEAVVAGHGASTASNLVTGILLTVAASAALGLLGGWLLAKALQRGYVPEYLKAPVLLGSALVVFYLADLVQHEAGLAAATVLGLVLGNARLSAIDELRRFKEYVVILIVSAVFVLLTASLEPADLVALGPRHALLLAVLLFVVRPLTVYLATIGADLHRGERLLIAWIAPRGVVAAAVAASFAGPLLNAGYADARLLVPLMFSFITVTVFAHGFSIRFLAAKLGLASPTPNGLLLVGSNGFSVDLARSLVELGVTVVMADSSWHRLRRARMAGIPVHYGDVASETSEESLELNPIGSLLAATGNDAYNALVCTTFAPELGRNHVYQLPLAAAEEGDPRGLRHTMRGTIVFETDAVQDLLLRRHYQGWQIRKTELTDSYDADAHRDDAEEGAMLLLLVRPGGRLVFHTENQPLAPQPGDTVVSYVPGGGKNGKAVKQ
jgi:NhaP-type Na+/H+ or K+/H+ antiporter